MPRSRLKEPIASGAAKKRQHGSPEHVPTQETIAAVRRMVGFGFTHDDIGTALGIDPKTLRKHYREHLAAGAIVVNEKIVGALFNKAMRGDTTALIWWTKARLGWSEKSRHEVSGVDGGPVQVEDARAILAERLAALTPGADSAATNEGSAKPAR